MEEMRIFFQNRAAYALENMQNYLGITGEVQPVSGDVNRNGTLELADAVLFFRLLSEKRAPELAELDVSGCDLDGDGLLTLHDASLMMRALEA